jgi:hypothetical protein
VQDAIRKILGPGARSVYTLAVVRNANLPPAFYLNCETCRELEIVPGIRWLLEQAKENGGTPLIVTYVVDQAGRVQATVPGANRIATESLRTYARSGWQGGPVLAVWPDMKMLQTLDDDWRVKAICAVPWTLDRIRDWIRGRQAKDVTGTAEAAGVPQLDPVVERALEGLTISVNLGTALSNPMDRTMAVHSLRALQKARYNWTPEDILAWALGHGWTNRGAQELAAVARGVKEGRRFQIDKGMRPERDLIAYWKAEVEKGKRG